MDCYTLIILAGLTAVASAWSFPFFPVDRAPQIRVTRFAPLPPRHSYRIRPEPFISEQQAKPKPERPKRDYDYDDDRDDNNHNSDNHNEHNHNSDNHNDHNQKINGGITGPVHTFVKTDKNANYKWGVRHHVGNKYAS